MDGLLVPPTTVYAKVLFDDDFDSLDFEWDGSAVGFDNAGADGALKRKM